MNTTSVSELGYLFLTMSSLHIIAQDLDVSVRHSKAPPLEVLGAHLLWGYRFFLCTPIGRGETSLQYGDV
jgi:hypothetical protein